MSDQPYLEFHLHLINGNTHKFVQKDPNSAEQILNQFNLKVFSLPSVIISCDNKIVTYQGSSLMGVSLMMKEIPDEILKMNRNTNIFLQEITEEDFHARHIELKPVVEYQPIVMLNQIEFITGKKIWIEAHIPHAATGIQERQLLHNWFLEKILLCHRIGGGITMWSRAHMMSCTISPKPEVPSNSWPAEPI